MSLPLRIRIWLALAAVAFLAAPSSTTGQNRIPREQLQAVVERTLAAGALPDDPTLDREALTASLDALVEASPEDPLATLAQRAAWRVRVTATSPVIAVHPSTPGLQIDTDRLFDLARPWVLRADVDVSVDGGSWARIRSLVTGTGGCGGVGPVLPFGPGVHHVQTRMTLTFFEPTNEKNLCGNVAGDRVDPQVAEYSARSPRPLWQEVRSSQFSYAVYLRPGVAGRLPDDYFVAIARTTAASVEPGLPDIPFEDWLVRVIGDKAATTPRWTMDYCGEGRDADGSRSLCGQALVPLTTDDGRRVIVRLQIGKVTAEDEWQAARPTFREAFITNNADSIELRRLGDLRAAVAASPDTWPVVDLQVASSDITYAAASPLPGQVMGRARIGATVRNDGLRDAPQSAVRLFVSCGDAAPAVSGRAGMVDPRGEVRKETVKDIAANASVTFEWEVAPPCATPWVLVHAFYLPRPDGWRAIAFEPDGNNNFAAIHVGTSERVR